MPCPHFPWIMDFLCGFSSGIKGTRGGLGGIEKLLAFDESQPEVNIRLAQAFLWTDKGDEALAALQKADAFIGDYPEIIRTKQFIYLKKKMYLRPFGRGNIYWKIFRKSRYFHGIKWSFCGIWCMDWSLKSCLNKFKIVFRIRVKFNYCNQNYSSRKKPRFGLCENQARGGG